MAKWAKVDANGKLISDVTNFPPASCLPGERVTFVDKIYHKGGSSPDKFHYTIDEGDNNVTAKYIPASPRGKWEIEAIASSVRTARELVNKMLTNLGLHGSYIK